MLNLDLHIFQMFISLAVIIAFVFPNEKLGQMYNLSKVLIGLICISLIAPYEYGIVLFIMTIIVSVSIAFVMINDIEKDEKKELIND